MSGGGTIRARIVPVLPPVSRLQARPRVATGHKGIFIYFAKIYERFEIY
jgi:hypothetical protein